VHRQQMPAVEILLNAAQSAAGFDQASNNQTSLSRYNDNA